MGVRYFNLIFFVFWGPISFSQGAINFDRLPIRLNESEGVVTHMVEDSLGFVWLAHQRGVSRLDGYTYKTIGMDSVFGKQDTYDYVEKIFKDDNGTIWALSENGKLAFLGENERFLSIDDKIGDFQNRYNIDLAYPKNGKVWMATHQGGVLAYDLVTGQLDSITTIPYPGKGLTGIDAMVVRDSGTLVISAYLAGMYTYSPETKKLEEFKLPEGYVQNGEDFLMLLDKKGRLWITSTLIENGLSVYDFDTNTYVQDDIFKGNLNGGPRELYISMYCDTNGTMWLGTDGNGLYKVDPESGAFDVYKHDGLNKSSLSSNVVVGINEDSHQNLWVFPNYGEINVLRHVPKSIQYHPGTINNRPARVLSSYRASDGTLWIGTDGMGITKISPDGKESQFLTNLKGNKGNYIQCIKEDGDGNIWVGTYKNGLWIYVPGENRFFKKALKNSNGINVQYVWCIFKDSKNRLWVATGWGLYLFSHIENRIAFFEGNTHGLIGTSSQSIVEDNEGNIWVAYDDGGLFKFEENHTDISKSYFDPMDFSANQTQGMDKKIYSMTFDGDHTIWIVNEKRHLVNFDIKNKKYNSLPNQTIQNESFRSIMAENKNTLWLGSKRGIWRYSKKDSLMEPFLENDGFRIDSYLSRSIHKGSDGHLYLGGVNGLHYFRPNEIRKKESKANLFIEEIEIPVGPVTSVYPKKDMDTKDKLELNYRQSSFLFRFLAIDNVLFPNFRYSYRLKGFNDTWIPSGKERIASYTNIPPGDYVFEVRAGLKNGEWTVGQKSIAVSIAPPIWKTVWAYLVYALVAVGLIYGMVTWLRLRNKFHAEKLMHEHDKEIFELKMDFFAKMSHEIQTPLTLILTPLDKMMKNAAETGNDLLQQRVRIIANNAKRLSRIVFELTSLRDKEMDQLSLRPVEKDFVRHLNEIASAFEEQAKFRKIDFKISCPAETLLLSYDTHKMEHIIYNLLGNAFKFTPKGGAISMDVAVEEWERKLKISITDSGPGIPKQELDNIFRLFYQADQGKQKNGTGIGLALTKELVDLHGGTINVKSSHNRGTCFTVHIPMDEKALQKVSKVQGILPDPQATSGLPMVGETSLPKRKFDKTLLVVEDNYELQIALKDIFDTSYNMLSAENGEEGYEMTLKHRPNLIISDIMMPKMNGIEMVSMLQKNKLTAHIPVILLTAKNEKKDKIEGLRSGALEYMGKPFSTSELIIKVNNILTRSDRLMAKYKNDLLNLPKNVNTRSQDDIFLEKLVESIESKMGDPEFKLEELADDLNMSYWTLYRRFQSLTGKTLINFVRTMRLKKAYLLISEADYPIAQAAFATGFNDPKYFSKCFRKEFGKTPNLIRKEIKRHAKKELS